MFNLKLVEEFTARMSESLANSPAGDIEKNLRAALAGLFAKLDLVTREELDVQTAVLQRAQERLLELETRLVRLETPPAPD
jgi:ubiquinone biosynthesis accessory factor UbiK